MESASTSVSRKEYLKKYADNPEDDKKKKKKKKSKKKSQSEPMGVLVVDEDPIWQKPVKIVEEEDEDDSQDEAKPQINEDIEVKHMKRMEQIRSRQAVEGSGWVLVSDAPSKADVGHESGLPESERNRLNSISPDRDFSPTRRSKSHPHERHDSPRRSKSHPHERHDSPDLSPPRRNFPTSQKVDSSAEDISPSRHNYSNYQNTNLAEDISPPRRNRAHSQKDDDLVADISHPHRKRPHSQITDDLPEDISPPRRSRQHSQLLDASVEDISPPRRNRPHSQRIDDSVEDDSPSRRNHLRSRRIDASVEDISPPRRNRPHSQRINASVEDLSPPRKQNELGVPESSDLSPPRKFSRDLSPPRKSKIISKEAAKNGLITAQDVKKEIERKKKDDLARYKELDPSVIGKGAEGVYRDKAGKPMSKEEFLKLQKGDEKPKEKKLEWGKGLVQKREAELRERELELEKEKPFARTRDDPELDKMLKERVRFGDPMAHLVKPKHSDFMLEDFGKNEKMKESGFIVPQSIPSHSWIKRRIDAPPNRYGIKPGRHWDGVDRSNGYEKEYFKRSNEKQANEKEAYLWSVSDM